MNRAEIITAINDVLNDNLVSEIAQQFALADKEYNENKELRRRVEWLETQIKDIAIVLEREQTVPDHRGNATDGTVKNCNSQAYAADRERYFSSLRGRSNAIFSYKEDL